MLMIIIIQLIATKNLTKPKNVLLTITDGHKTHTFFLME